MSEILRTYKFYDNNGRRLGIFAIPEKRGTAEDSSDVLKLYIITCAKKDSFNKKKAVELFETYRKYEAIGELNGTYKELKSDFQCSPDVTYLPIEQGKFKSSLNNFLNNIYRKRYLAEIGIPGEARISAIRKDYNILGQLTTFVEIESLW
jgi:hypothetical protein